MKEFFKDDKTYDAVMRNIQIIGEAIKHLPSDVRKEYKNVEMCFDSHYTSLLLRVMGKHNKVTFTHSLPPLHSAMFRAIGKGKN